MDTRILLTIGILVPY